MSEPRRFERHRTRRTGAHLLAQRTDLLARLGATGEVALPSLTSEELVAAGARSPLPGLLVSERLAAMGIAPLTAALGAALRSLIARGLLEGASSPRGAGERGTRLGAELELVVALTRAPDFVALVSAPRPAELAGLSLTSARSTARVLHGHVAQDGHIVLEEQICALGIHRFALRTLPTEARALAGWLSGEASTTPWRDKEDGSAVGVEVELTLPHPTRGWHARNPQRRRWSIVLDPEQGWARLVPTGPGGERTAIDLAPPALGDALARVLGDALGDLGGPAARRGA